MLGNEYKTLNGYRWRRYNYYQSAAGDSWDMIAHHAYDNAELSPILLHCNPEHAHLLLLEGGEIITIPILDMAASERMPPWKGGSV